MRDQSEAARVIFRRLDSEFLLGMVGKEFESNILECKEKSTPSSPDLEASDVSSFAKALSGFANTGGGVLLWGVRARKVADIDQIQELVPIGDLNRFEAKLRERESTLVEYVVPDVEYKQIILKAGGGVLAMLVPQSPLLPHRVNLKTDHHFYIRAGGTFSPLPLSIVEDLFSRRAAPVLEPFLRQTGAGSLRTLQLGLRNIGKASARFPFVVVLLPQFLKPTGYELDEGTRLASWVQIREYRGKSGRFWSWIGGNQQVVHPGQELGILNLWTSDTQLNGPVKFEIEYFIYSERMPLQTGICEINTL